MLNFFPKYFTNRAIALYFVSLLAAALLHLNHIMEWYAYVIGIAMVLFFFMGSNQLLQNWQKLPDKSFVKNLFISALLIRVAWVVISYVFYQAMTGIPFEFNTMDAQSYHIGANDILIFGWNEFGLLFSYADVSDRGYFAYLGGIYTIFAPSVMIARLIQAGWSAYTVILVYKLATRNFGTDTGRMAGIFCMLYPALIHYCGLHNKETVMLFLTVLAIERADHALRSPKFTFSNLILPVACAIALFYFRTVLAIATLFAFLTAIFFASQRAGKTGKRVILGIWVTLAIAFLIGGRLLAEVETLWAQKDDAQQYSIQWRAKRVGGNTFSSLASRSIFAPMIFIIPITTEVNVPYQENQQMENGGNFTKNLMAFFVMLAIVHIVTDAIRKGNKWRDFLLIETIFVGYLLIIAFSQFAQSGRFHMPAIPFFVMFAAYGVSISTKGTKKYYNLYLGLLFVIIVAWQWFKLAGRGME